MNVLDSAKRKGVGDKISIVSSYDCHPARQASS